MRGASEPSSYVEGLWGALKLEHSFSRCSGFRDGFAGGDATARRPLICSCLVLRVELKGRLMSGSMKRTNRKDRYFGVPFGVMLKVPGFVCNCAMSSTLYRKHQRAELAADESEESAHPRREGLHRTRVRKRKPHAP